MPPHRRGGPPLQNPSIARPAPSISSTMAQATLFAVSGIRAGQWDDKCVGNLLLLTPCPLQGKRCVE